MEIIQLRQDFEERLQEKEKIIAGLREEKQLLMSKAAIYEMTLMPHASRAGAELVAYQKPTKPNFSFVDIPAPKSRWQQQVELHDKQIAEELAKEETEKKETAAAVAV